MFEFPIQLKFEGQQYYLLNPKDVIEIHDIQVKGYRNLPKATGTLATRLRTVEAYNLVLGKVDETYVGYTPEGVGLQFYRLHTLCKTNQSNGTRS